MYAVEGECNGSNAPGMVVWDLGSRMILVSYVEVL
jgi:hypothetical protein